jgi:hypothetical protein
MEPQINIPQNDIYAFGDEKALNIILINYRRSS